MITKSLIALLLFVSLSYAADAKKYYINVYFNDAGIVEFIEFANETGTDYIRFNLAGAFMGYAGKNTTYSIRTTYVNGKDICQIQSAYVNDIKLEIFSSFNRVDNIKAGENNYDVKYSFDDFESIRSGVKSFSFKTDSKGNHDFKNDFTEIAAYSLTYTKM